MPRFTFTVDSGKLAQATVNVNKPVARHGPPRWGHAFRRGKGGQEIRPPYMVAGSRLPDVSLGEGDYERAKRRKLLNLVADAAIRHDMPIPDAPRYVPMTVEQHKAQLRKELQVLDKRDEAQQAERIVKADLRQKATRPLPPTVRICGSCGKLIAALLETDEYKQHQDLCPRKVQIFKDFIARSARVQNLHQRATILREQGSVEEGRQAEAKLTKDDLANSASDTAIAASKQDRVQYIQASAYSEEHK